jgi:hypothetical protein
MTPNRQSPAYALFARRPIVPQPPDVPAADPPASREPLPPSGTEDTAVTECPLPASAPIVKRPRQKAAKADLHTGVWPTNFERLRETKDSSAPCPLVIPCIASFQAIEGNPVRSG